MSVTSTRTFCGYCPQMNADVSLSVTVREMRILGDLDTHIMPINYSCPETDGVCELADNSGCPVFTECKSLWEC